MSTLLLKYILCFSFSSLFLIFLSHRLHPVLFLFTTFHHVYSLTCFVRHIALGSPSLHTHQSFFVSRPWCFLCPSSFSCVILTSLSSSTCTKTWIKTPRCIYTHGVAYLFLSLHFQSFFVVSFSSGHPFPLDLSIRGGSHSFSFFHRCHTFHIHSTPFFAHLSSTSFCSNPPPSFLSSTSPK